MSFGFTEAAAIPAWGVFCFLPSLMYSFNKAAKDDAHHTNRTSLSIGAIFAMWILMPLLLTVSIYYFTLIAVVNSWQLIMGVVCFMVHVASSILYRRMYWNFLWVRASMAPGALKFLTAIGFIVAISVDHVGGPVWWVPIVTFSLYLAFWLVELWGNLGISIDNGTLRMRVRTDALKRSNSNDSLFDMGAPKNAQVKAAHGRHHQTNWTE